MTPRWPPPQCRKASPVCIRTLLVSTRRGLSALFINQYNDLPLERQSGGADITDTFRNEKRAGKAGPLSLLRALYESAACTMISTLSAGLASLASTVARAGALPGDIQA